MTTSDITLNVDIANPGQFFACCGLLELADKIWPGVEGWFEDTSFQLKSVADEAVDLSVLLDAILSCEITNTMELDQWGRYNILTEKKTSEFSKLEKEEKKQLDKLVREEPIVFNFGGPFSLQIDWFYVSEGGGDRFKTWAGQQSVLKIAIAMQEAMRKINWENVDAANLLLPPAENDKSVPFYFDSNIAPQSSSIDVGYSLDTLKMSVSTRPFIELAAFIGLQRFRPLPEGKNNRFHYRAWRSPLPIPVAAVAAASTETTIAGDGYAFSLLYRTKYLKSFLPASPTGVTE